MSKPRRKYVAKGIVGGFWRIWNRRAKRWWGENYRAYPEFLLNELNGQKRPEKLTEYIRLYQRLSP